MAGNDDRIPLSVQQSIATAIAFSDDDNTRYVASTVDINLLDAPLDDIVARCLEYRKKYQQAPGAHHIDEVLASILEEKAILITSHTAAPLTQCCGCRIN
jgi:hypothetical protein